MTEAGVTGRRINRRGAASRENLLAAAVHSLSSGDPRAVSANRIAKEVGATWGTVKYQFGDVDGFWAAVLHHTAEQRGELATRTTAHSTTTSVRERVSLIIEMLYAGLDSTQSRAIENLRAALPRDGEELERAYPKTAAELASWTENWAQDCAHAFGGLGLDEDKLRTMAAFLPGAMRGMVSEKQLGTYSDLERARRGLTDAIVAYLEK